jgi:hypothetical protein
VGGANTPPGRKKSQPATAKKRYPTPLASNQGGGTGATGAVGGDDGSGSGGFPTGAGGPVGPTGASGKATYGPPSGPQGPVGIPKGDSPPADVFAAWQGFTDAIGTHLPMALNRALSLGRNMAAAVK